MMRKAAFGTMTVFAILAIAFAYSLSNPAEAAETLDIGSVYRPPLSNSEGTGMIDLIVKQAFSRIGAKAQIIPSDRTQALEKANKGLYDGDLMRVEGASEKYPNLIRVPESLYDYDFVAFGKNANVPMTGWEGLKAYRVGISEGSVELSKNVTEQNTKSVIRIKSPFELFNTIIKGETDLIIYERMMGYEQIREAGMADIHVLEPPLSSKPMFLYLNNKHKDLIPRLAAAISDMKKDGTIPKIVAETLGKYKK